MANNIHLELTVKDGRLQFSNDGLKAKYNNFLNNIPEGSKVELFISVCNDKGSDTQLARLHAMIRELSSGLGYTFDEMKLIIKKHSGLSFTENDEIKYKSFANCTKDELSLAIQSCITIADFNEIQIR